MTDSPAQRAIHAIERVLAEHRRTLSGTGKGWTCACGNHYDTGDQWDRHRAELATDAAAAILTPP